jgi:DNA modification methylase
MRRSFVGAENVTAVLDDDLTYLDFLKEKVNFDRSFGFSVPESDVSAILKPHQRDIVRWAVLGGRRAIFAAFGLGKSLMQLEIMRLVLARESGRALIVCPLGVRQEFTRDARDLLGIDVTFVRRSDEVEADGIYLTNYESLRDGKLDPNLFKAVSLDEASVLRSYGSKTYQTFLPLFDQVKYRFVATATPSPNRYKELIHYAGFLGVMDTGAALTRFFQRDSTQANNLTLYPHKEAEFWLWLNSWAIFLQSPSDIGYSDEGYDLPAMEVVWHEVAVNHSGAGHDRDGQARMFKNSALGVTDSSREKRETLGVRIAKTTELVNESPDDHFILWHDLEDERRALKRSLPEAVEVYGALDLDIREERIIGFSDGAFRLLATKPRLSGSGCNFQRHCHRAIFVGVGFKFNDFIQALHRIQRFQQEHPVRVDIIYAESEREVVHVLQRKWDQHRELTEQMSTVIREHGLNQTSITEALERSMGVERVEVSGDGWLIANNDCVLETRSMQTDSVDLIVTSIPFSNHYEYTPAYEDFGHTDDNDHFWAQMDFLTPELLRILQPGRLYCCHVKDRILFGNVTGAGAPTVSPFHAEALMHGIKHGFDYMGMITVVTDVVRENNQSYRLGWSEQCKDGSKMGVGSPEYVLLFRKPQSDRTRGYADVPVVKDKEEYPISRWQVDAHSFWRSSGNRQITPEEISDPSIPTGQRMKLFESWSLNNVYDYESHVRIGDSLDGCEGRSRLPRTFMALAPGSNDPNVWHDVNRMLTLNSSQSHKAQVMHVCPMQFDIVDRLINRYSNPKDLVFDPFGGLQTVPMRALKLGRRGRGVELNPGYFLDGVRYLQAMEQEISSPSLFDLLDAAS